MGFVDPAEVVGTEAERLEIFSKVRNQILGKILDLLENLQDKT